MQFLRNRRGFSRLAAAVFAGGRFNAVFSERLSEFGVFPQNGGDARVLAQDFDFVLEPLSPLFTRLCQTLGIPLFVPFLAGFR